MKAVSYFIFKQILLTVVSSSRPVIWMTVCVVEISSRMLTSDEEVMTGVKSLRSMFKVAIIGTDVLGGSPPSLARTVICRKRGVTLLHFIIVQ